MIIERLFIDGMAPGDIEDGTPLKTALGLDSVDAIELAVGLEQKFEIEVVGAGIDQDSFESVDTLTEFVLGRLAEPKK